MTAAPSRYQTQMLMELVEAGHGRLDKQGRVTVEPIGRPITGDPVAWLVLVSLGLVAGEDGLVLPTQAGRDMVTHRIGGTVREARG